MRTRRLTWQLPVVAALAGVWAAAAYFLWESRVPSNLSLANLDPRSFFTANVLSRTSRFEQFLELSWIGKEILLIGVFAAYALWGTRFMRDSAAERVGTGIFLAMMGFALAWFVQVPFEILDTWWERRYGVLKVGYVEVVLGGWLALGFTFLTLSVAVAIVMGLASWFRRTWWIAAVPVFVGIALVQTFVGPYLLGGRSLAHDNPALAAAAQRIQHKEGLSGIPVEVLDVHSYTPEENAFATGLGSSRKVFVFDTLLTGGLTERQLEAVLAHEYGHQARDHLWKEARLVRAVRLSRGAPGRARLPATGRHLPARVDPRGPARGRPLQPRRPAAPERDQPALRGRSRLDVAPDDARPGRAPGSDGALRRQGPRRPRSADVGLRALRRPPDPDAADRHGEGVAGAKSLRVRP